MPKYEESIIWSVSSTPAAAAAAYEGEIRSLGGKLQESTESSIKGKFGSDLLFRLGGLSMAKRWLPLNLVIELKSSANGTDVSARAFDRLGKYVVIISAVEQAYEERFTALLSAMQGATDAN